MIKQRLLRDFVRFPIEQVRPGCPGEEFVVCFTFLVGQNLCQKGFTAFFTASGT